MNINLKQGIALTIAVLGVLMISESQLAQLLGVPLAKGVTSASALLNSILGASMAVLTSQGNTVADTRAMPGVESIVVNERANKTLAQMAVDPREDKVSIKTGDAQAVVLTAEGK